MSLSGWAVHYRIVVVSIVLMLMVAGVAAFFTMPRREDPEFTIRICVVSTLWPGAPAETVEELVTDPIEQKLSGIQEVKLTTSTTRTGQSTIFVELEDSVPVPAIQNVWDKVRARVELVEMPAPSVRPIVNDEFGDTSVLLLAIHQTPVHGRKQIRDDDRYTPRQLEVFAERVQDELRLLDGVGKVDMFGAREEAVYIETDLGNWSQLGLTTATLQRLASERNIIEPGGEIDTATGHYLVKPGGEFNAVGEIGQIASVVSTDDGNNSVQLSDLGLTVTRDYKDPADYFCRFGDLETSDPAVMLGITMKSGGNIVTVCNLAKQRVRELIELEQNLPADIAVTPVSDQSDNVTAKISEVIINVIEAIAIVVVVVFLVVGFRSAFVMAANIPVVVLISIGLISLFGVQLEQISLAALIISLGLLVDNAVQVCDQARTNQIQGMSPIKAAVEGARTLSVPMLVGTLTTVAAFLPMLIALKGGSAEYVYSLPVTVSTTLVVSWFLAMTFCVILAAAVIRAPVGDAPGSPVVAFFRWARSAVRFRRTKSKTPAVDQPSESQAKESDANESDANKSETNESEPWIFSVYGFFAGLAVRLKWLTALATVGLFIAVMSLPVSSEFFPQANRDQFAVRIFLPETATIAQTNEKALQVESILRKLGKDPANGQPRLRAMRTLVGGGGSRWHLGWDPEPLTRSFAEVLVRTVDGRQTAQFARDLREACERGNSELGIKPVVGARVIPVQLALGPPADPLVLRVVGSGFADPQKLKLISQRVKTIVAAQAETWDVNDSWGAPGYQVQVNIKQNRAVMAGVTNSQVAQTLNSYFSGLELTRFREGDHTVPVYFRIKPSERQSIRGLQESYVEGERGKIPLSAIADFQRSFELAKIERRNRNRVIEVSSQMEPGVTGNDVVLRVLASDEMEALRSELPLGFRIEPGGAFEESAEAGGQMMLSFGLSFVLIILCLIFQFNGWSKTLVILATLPMALMGAWLGLFLSNLSLGFMPQLGILALFGIVLNTAIIFFEFADMLIAERSKASDGSGPIVGLSVAEFRDCLVEAGKQRMLPIFLTTATTVGGLLPLALSGGPLWQGLAWCMIAGLLLSTVLTLIVVPALYAIMVETIGIKPIAAEVDA